VSEELARAERAAEAAELAATSLSNDALTLQIAADDEEASSVTGAVSKATSQLRSAQEALANALEELASTHILLASTATTLDSCDLPSELETLRKAALRGNRLGSLARDTVLAAAEIAATLIAPARSTLSVGFKAGEAPTMTMTWRSGADARAVAEDFMNGNQIEMNLVHLTSSPRPFWRQSGMMRGQRRQRHWRQTRRGRWRRRTTPPSLPRAAAGLGCVQIVSKLPTTWRSTVPGFRKRTFELCWQ